MSQQQIRNEAIAHRFHMNIFQEGKLEMADEIIASDFVWRNPVIPSELQHGPESVKKIASAVIEAIPDRQIIHDDTIAKGDKVMIRWTMTGTTKRELFGISQVYNGFNVCFFACHILRHSCAHLLHACAHL